MTKTTTRTNIHISAESRAILSALGAASTGKPTLAGGLAELVARVTDGIRPWPVRPGDKNTQWRAYWVHPGQTDENNDPVSQEAAAAIDAQATEYSYPTRADAIAAAVLLRFEEGRARALAEQAEADREAAEVAAEQEHNYNAIIRESLRMP